MSTSVSIQLVTEQEFTSVPCASALESFISLVGLRAPLFVPDEVRERAGMDIVAVLDRSGSMAGEKMKMMHTTVNMMIDVLSPADRLSLVSYDDRSEVHTQLTKMDKPGKELAKAALKQITDRGMTNLSGGLFDGLKVLQARADGKNEVSSVLLMTDGLANRGVVSPTELVAQTQAILASMNNPTSIYTFGFGSDHNSELLMSLARGAHGTYYFMKDSESVPTAFADCLGGLMSVIAQNIKLTITPCDGIVIKSVSSAFPTTEDPVTHAHTLAIGDLFSEEERDILVDVSIPPTATPMDQPLLHCSLKYLNVITASSDVVESLSTLQRTGPDAPLGESSRKVDQQRNRLQTAKAMEEARKLADTGKLHEAQELLTVTSEAIAQSRSADISRDLVQDLTSVHEKMQTATMYRAEGGHRLMNKMNKHGMQRACESDDREVQSYSTAARSGMRSLFKK